MSFTREISGSCWVTLKKAERRGARRRAAPRPRGPAGARGGGGEARVRREEADGVVSPVVGAPALHEGALVHVVVHRQELHGRDPQGGQVLERRRRGESRIGAPRRG